MRMCVFVYASCRLVQGSTSSTVGRDDDLWMCGVWAGGSPSVSPVHSEPNLQHRKEASLLSVVSWRVGGEKRRRLCHD